MKNKSGKVSFFFIHLKFKCFTNSQIMKVKITIEKLT